MPNQGPGRPSSIRLEVTPELRIRLEDILRKDKLPYGFTVRCRIVLLYLDGDNMEEIGYRVGMKRQHIAKWLKRFQQRGLYGLQDRRFFSGRKKKEPPISS